MPCNWLQHWENVVDPFHVPVLHGSFSGAQFVAQMAQVPKVEFSTTERGVKVLSLRTLEDGRLFRRVTEAVIPTLRVVPNPRVGSYGKVESIGWVLPIDDTHYRIYVAGRVTEKGQLGKMRSKMNGKFWWELTEEEHQRFPGDYEAQTGTGADHASLRGALRHQRQGRRAAAAISRAAVEKVAEGADPACVAFDETSAYVRFEAGNYLADSAVAE